jgi:hypothetical protein
MGQVIEVDFHKNKVFIDEVEQTSLTPQDVLINFANVRIAYVEAHRMIFSLCQDDADKLMFWSEALIRTDNIMSEDAVREGVCKTELKIVLKETKT